MTEINSSTRALSVAMVNTARHRGGAARMAVTLANALSTIDAGVHVHLYHGEDRVAEGRCVGLRRRGGRPLNAILARLGGSCLVRDLGLSAEVAVRSAQADVLHVHNLHGYYINYVELLEGWADRPIVWTWHDAWGATGRCAYPRECDLWRTGCRQCPHREYYPSAWLDFAGREYAVKTELYRRLAWLTIVVPSAWLAAIATKRGFHAAQIHVVPNPIDTAVFTPRGKKQARAKLGLPQDAPVALFVASECADPLKGYQDFAWAALNCSAVAVAVGQEPARRVPGVRHAGPVSDRERLAEYYSAADVLVVPSKSDNYPNTVGEAIACGTAVVGYAVGGIPQQVPEWGGLLVPSGDRDALGGAVRRMVERVRRDPALPVRLRDHALASWAPESVARHYLAIYREAVGGRCPRAETHAM